MSDKSKDLDLGDSVAELAAQLKFFSEIGVTHLKLGGQQAVRQNEDRQPVGTVAQGLTLETIRADLGDCTRCQLSETRKNLVFGVGALDADLMFVGEAPGEEEDLQGIPFVGRAGQLLTRIIEAIGLERDQVYIANILKCRPPNNRDPQPQEVEQCEPFLFKQIEAVNPMIVVALGRYAAQTLLRTTETIGKLRGRFFDFKGILLMPTFHPSYLLRNPSAKREVWTDMQKVRDTLRERGSSCYKD